jgi:hypothetical protein
MPTHFYPIMRDIYQVSHALDDTTAQNVMERAECRGTDPAITRVRDIDLDNVSFPPSARILRSGAGQASWLLISSNAKDSPGV